MRHLITLLVLMWSGLALSKPIWELMRQDEGIHVYRAKMAGSDIYGFRGEATIKAPIEKIYDVLADREHRKDWVDRLSLNKELAKVNDNEVIVYQSFNLPWPIANRDFVYKAKSQRTDDDTVVITLASTEYEEAPETIGVRAHLYHSKYVLKSLGPKQTKVMVEIHTDPKGSLPSWLVNLIQKSWPSKTLKGIQKQVKKSFVKMRNLPEKVNSPSDLSMGS